MAPSTCIYRDAGTNFVCNLTVVVSGGNCSVGGFPCPAPGVLISNACDRANREICRNVGFGCSLPNCRNL
jgi:hypothetical protein